MNKVMLNFSLGVVGLLQAQDIAQEISGTAVIVNCTPPKKYYQQSGI